MSVDKNEAELLELLDKMGIKYRRYEHAAARTMQDCEGIGADVGAEHFKNLFLTNRAGNKFYLLLICADKPFRTGNVSKQLNSSRLSFASDTQLFDKLGLIAGSVTPMALYRESARDVVVAIDEDILKMNMVCVHPCVSSASLAISLSDLLAFIKAMGNEVRTVSV